MELKHKIHYKSKWLFFFPRNVVAFTVGRHIYCRSDNPSEQLLRHETAHILQYEKYGIIRFLLIYYLDYLSGLTRYQNHNDAYLNIPFEVEARKFESNL